MEWKLYDIDGKYLQDVNCQYDASDLAVMLYEAKVVKIDFNRKEAYILEQERSNDRMSKNETIYRKALEEIVRNADVCFGNEYPDMVLRIAKQALIGK